MNKVQGQAGQRATLRRLQCPLPPPALPGALTTSSGWPACGEQPFRAGVSHVRLQPPSGRQPNWKSAAKPQPGLRLRPEAQGTEPLPGSEPVPRKRAAGLRKRFWEETSLAPEPLPQPARPCGRCARHPLCTQQGRTVFLGAWLSSHSGAGTHRESRTQDSQTSRPKTQKGS